jgi:hypothetical protein
MPMVETMARPTYRVGDVVEVIDQVPGRKQLRPGAHGIGVCVGFSWDAVSVRIGDDPDRGPLYLLAPRHLHRVAD